MVLNAEEGMRSPVPNCEIQDREKYYLLMNILIKAEHFT